MPSPAGESPWAPGNKWAGRAVRRPPVDAARGQAFRDRGRRTSTTSSASTAQPADESVYNSWRSRGQSRQPRSGSYTPSPRREMPANSLTNRGRPSGYVGPTTVQRPPSAREVAYDESRKLFDTRARARGVRRGDREERIVELTNEEWNALSPQEQQVVTFNTELRDAVERDRIRQDTYNPTDEQRTAYDKALDDLFGTSYSRAPNGIEYAPETVGFLTNAGINPHLGAGSLDDFLKMDVAISSEDMKQIDKSLGPEGPSHLVGERKLTSSEKRLKVAQTLAAGQRNIDTRIQRTLAQGESLLTGLTTDISIDTAKKFGGTATAPFSDARMPEKDEDRNLVSLYMETLADSSFDPGEVLSEIELDLNNMGYSAERKKKIYDGMMAYIGQTVQGEQEWYPADGPITWRTPQEVAESLGFGSRQAG